MRGARGIALAVSAALLAVGIWTLSNAQQATYTKSTAVTDLTGLGTNVATALAIAVGSSGAIVTNGGALGTPSSGIATNLTGTASGLTAGNVTAIVVGTTTVSSGNSGRVHYTNSTTLGEYAVSGSGSTVPLATETTWTPTITTDGTVGTPAYTRQVGSYEQIGRQITARFVILLSGWTGSPTGNVSIGGLPVTSTSTTNDRGGCYIFNYGVAGLAALTYGITGLILPGTTTAQLLSNGSAGANLVTAAQFGTTGQVEGVCNYRA